MSRRLVALGAGLCLLGALPIVTSSPHAAATVPPATTQPPRLDAEATETATRGTAVQLTPTLPPPPTTVPVTFPPFDPTQPPWLSGTGRRAVYSIGRQRVWIIDGKETVLRTYLVSGRRGQPALGEYRVFSRSSYTCNIDHYWVCMRWMVRFAVGPKGDNIGFHEIPKDEGEWVQTVDQLGQPLSGGCVRQATEDALYMWNWAYIGTKVVVIA